jgi:hypothetical protein
MPAHSTRLTLSDIARSVPPGGSVIAMTDSGQDGRYEPVRRAAAELAARAGGRVMLFVDATARAANGQVQSRCYAAAHGTGDDLPGRALTGSRRDNLLADEIATMSGMGPTSGVPGSRREAASSG